MGIFDFMKRRTKKVKKQKIQKSKISCSFKEDTTNEHIANEVISLEERLKDTMPNDAGLYPHEILLISYAPTFYADKNNTFQRFWWYRYGIKDVNKILESLLERGFIKLGSLESAMCKATVLELKDILKENKLKVSGKKEVLINRLIEELEKDELNDIFIRRNYEITDLGREILKENEHIIYIHRNSIENLDIFLLNELVKDGSTGYPYRDVIWGYLNNRSIKHIREGKFGLYRNCRLAMSDFVREENKSNTAFALLVEVIRYDLSGLSNGFDMQFLYIYKKNFFPYEKSIVKMAPGIVRKVVEYKEYKKLSDQELKKDIIKYGEEIVLPFSVFTVDECADIVLLEINNDKEELIKIYSDAELRFNSQYKF